jgi:heat-inducible transcriptional repressor
MAASEPIDLRSRDVFRAAVETYIASAEPVASKTLVRPLNLSSALIRGIMNGLETRGLLQQPHTSAGRIPTVAGYRHYVDELIVPANVSARLAPLRLSVERENTRTLMRACLAAMVGATGLTAFAVSATHDDDVHHYLELVRVGPKQVLATFVGRSGTVRQRLVKLEADLGEGDLVRFRNVLNERFNGTSLRRIHETLDDEIARARAMCAELELAALALSRLVLPDPAEPSLDVAVAGQHFLLGLPEFQVGLHAARVFEELERQETWLRLLQAVASSPGISVLIGHENPVDGLKDCAVVLTQVGWGDDQDGTVGIVGPMRMAYATVMATVEVMRASVAIASDSHRFDGPRSGSPRLGGSRFDSPRLGLRQSGPTTGDDL